MLPGEFGLAGVLTAFRRWSDGVLQTVAAAMEANCASGAVAVETRARQRRRRLKLLPRQKTTDSTRCALLLTAIGNWPLMNIIEP